MASGAHRGTHAQPSNDELGSEPPRPCGSSVTDALSLKVIHEPARPLPVINTIRDIPPTRSGQYPCLTPEFPVPLFVLMHHFITAAIPRIVQSFSC